MSDGGKGSKQRPLGIDLITFENNWDKIFGKKEPDQVLTPEEKLKEEKLKQDD